MRKLLLLLLCLTSFSAFSNEAPLARFESSLKPLEKFLLTTLPQEAADNLIDGKSRIYTFDLQSLGKIYSNEHKTFRKLRFDFKRLEDGIGEYKKWRDILTEAQNRGVSASKLKKLEIKMLAGKEKLIELLQKDEWIEAEKIQRYRKFLSKFDFGSYKEDKENVLKFLIKALKRISQTEFDMGILEHGNGLHELRRELRWFLIETKVLNGLVAYKTPNQCSIDMYSSLPNQPIARSKYAILFSSPLEIKPCFISKCLFLALVQKVDQFGDYKDQIESDLNLQDVLTDETPEEYIDDLNKLYKELKSSKVLKELSTELQSCL